MQNMPRMNAANNTIPNFFIITSSLVGVSKESRLKGPGFGLSRGRGLSMMLLFSTYLWSAGVMEYWKNKTHLRFSGTLTVILGFSDA
jgi:hypothetical protein